MGGWEEFCLVCGGPAISPDLEEWLEYPEDRSEEEKEALRAALTGLEWLDRYVGVLGTEELIPLGPYNGMGGFDNLQHIDLGKTVSDAELHYDIIGALDWDPENIKYLALTCHEKCYNLLQTELGYTLRFQDVWPMLREQLEISNVSSPWGTSRASSMACNSFRWTSYGGIGVYQEQGFTYDQAVTDGNAWMLQDPTINERNASRIVEVWRPLVENGFKIPPQSSIDTVSPAEAIGSTVIGGMEGKPSLPGNQHQVSLREAERCFAPRASESKTPIGLVAGSHSMNAEMIRVETQMPRKEQMPKKNLNAPKPNRSAFNFYFAEQRQRLEVLHPDKDREITRLIGEAWNGLSDEEKLAYHELGVKDKERWRIETGEYRKKLKTGYYDKLCQ